MKRDPRRNDESPGLAWPRHELMLLLYRILPVLAVCFLSWQAWQLQREAQEWQQREQHTSLIRHKYPELASQFAAFDACVGSWHIFIPGRGRWLSCDLLQLQHARHRGLGAQYIRFMVDRDWQLQANRIRLYPVAGLWGDVS